MNKNKRIQLSYPPWWTKWMQVKERMQGWNKANLKASKNSASTSKHRKFRTQKNSNCCVNDVCLVRCLLSWKCQYIILLDGDIGKMKNIRQGDWKPWVHFRMDSTTRQTPFCSVFFILFCWMKIRPRIDLNGQVLKGDGKFSESFTFIDRKGLSSCLFEPALNQRLKQRKSAFWGPPRWKGPAPAFSLFWFFLPRCTEIDKPFAILWTTKSSVGEAVQFEFL